MKKPRLYYKVPEKQDNKYIIQSDMYLVFNELFTLREVILNGIPIDILIPVLISPDKTYTCFGCRFEDDFYL